MLDPIAPESIDVTVVVCTFNRCASLRDTLDSLVAMDVPHDVAWEIVVVDNNSTDATAEVVADVARACALRVRYLFEPTQGLSHARNRAIQATAATFIAFTDDDVLVTRDWLSRTLGLLRGQSADCVGGRIVPRWIGQRPQWLRDDLLNVLAMLDHGDTLLEIDLRRDERSLFGANFSFRRDALLRMGLFDVNLGRRGNSGAGEDHDMLVKLSAASARILYDPGIVVHHKVSPDRLRKSYFRHWHYAAGRDRAKFTRRSRFTVIGIESYLIRDFARTAARLLGSLARGRFDRAFRHQLRCILYLSIFKHKVLG